MKIETFELPVKSREGFESASVSAVQMARDGTLFCGLMFADKTLLRVKPGASGKAELIEDLELDAVLGGDVMGVVAGLRHSTSGDTVVSVLQGGMLPSLLRGFSGKEIKGKKGDELVNFLLAQDGGMGAAVRHSLVQLSEGQINVRRNKEPGVLWDCAHIGDFIFGVTRSAIWREPYMNSEKRETLRSDLTNNFALHRDPNGNFWVLGQNGRLMRMELTDIKAKPTPLKLPDVSGLFASSASYRDTWMYASCGEGAKFLVRIRRNPVSMEEEIQTVARFDERITSLCVIEAPIELSSASAQSPAEAELEQKLAEQQAEQQAASANRAPNILLVATEHPEGARLYALDIIVPEDPEMVPPPPAPREVGRFEGISAVSGLAVDNFDKDPVVWAGEGRLGWGASASKSPRLIKISAF